MRVRTAECFAAITERFCFAACFLQPGTSRYQKLVMYFDKPMCRLRCTAVTGPCRYFAYEAAFLLAFAV